MCVVGAFETEGSLAFRFREHEILFGFLKLEKGIGPLNLMHRCMYGQVAVLVLMRTSGEPQPIVDSCHVWWQNNISLRVSVYLGQASCPT